MANLHTFELDSTRRARWAWACAGIFLLSACGTQPERTPAGPTCSAADGYTITVIEDYESATAATAHWYGFGDDTPGAIPPGTIYAAMPPAVPTPPTAGPAAFSNLRLSAPPCPGVIGSGSAALRLVSRGHADWGSGFGEYGYTKGYPNEGRTDGSNTSNCPDAGVLTDGVTWYEGSGYEGLAIWARSPETNDVGVTDKTFIIGLNDRHSEALGGVCEMAPPPPTAMIDAGVGKNPCTYPGQTVDPAAPSPDPTKTCGNSFLRTLTVTSQWTLYLLPFNSFNQSYDPNRTTEPLDPSQLYSPVIRTPRGVLNMDLWIDSIGLYARKAATP